MYEFTRVENLNGDLTSIRARLNECRDAAREITETVHNRIIADKKNADRRAEELKKEIESDVFSDTIRRIKQNEIDAISCRRYEPTDSERAEFEQVILEYRSALNDLKGKQNDLKEAVRDAKHCLDDIHSNAYTGADPVLIDRHIDSEKKKFDELIASGEAKQWT